MNSEMQAKPSMVASRGDWSALYAKTKGARLFGQSRPGLPGVAFISSLLLASNRSTVIGSTKCLWSPATGRAGNTGGQGICAVGGQRLAKRTWTIEHKYCNQTALPNPAVNLTCDGRRFLPGGRLLLTLGFAISLLCTTRSCKTNSGQFP
jgi:hypothetical protein